jgi:hypothetical protein
MITTLHDTKATARTLLGPKRFTAMAHGIVKKNLKYKEQGIDILQNSLPSSPSPVLKPKITAFPSYKIH